MSLTKKIAFFTFLICILFLFFYFVIYHFTLSGPIKERKALYTQKIINKTLCALEGEIYMIQVISRELSSRDAIYDNIPNPGTDFFNELKTRLPHENSGIHLVMLIDSNKNIVFARGCDSAELQPVDLGIPCREGICRDTGLMDCVYRSFNRPYAFTRVIQMKKGHMIIVSSPILKSNGNGPARGRLLIGRFIDPSIERRISQSVGTKIRLSFICKKCDEDVGAVVREGLHKLSMEEGQNDYIIKCPLTDSNNLCISTIQVSTEKQVFTFFDKASRLYFISLITGFVLLGLAVYFLMNRLVVRRVKTISSITDNIITLDDLSRRIPETYRDEITLLSRTINRMLESLQVENLRKEEIERMATLNEKLIFLGRVTANITHDINNPLFALENAIQVLKRRIPPDDKKLSEIVQIMEKEIKLTKSITQDMHKFMIPRNEEKILADLSIIMDSAVNIIKWSKQLKNTLIEFPKKGKDFPVYCIPDALQQVFMNIIQNMLC